MQEAEEETRVEFVARWFNELKSEVDQLRATLNATNSSPSPTQLDELSRSMQQLKQELSQNADRIPVFELGRCEREIKAVQEAVSRSKGGLSTTKSKFSFRKTEPKSAPPKLPQPISDQPPAAPPGADSHRRKPHNIPSTSLTMSGKSECYLCSQDLPSTSASQALLLADLENSFVDLSNSQPTSFSALYLYGIRKSCIIVPPISGSIMVHDCHDCVIFLGSHQIPTSGSDKSLYDQVQDFDSPFASAETPSENFSLIDAETGMNILHNDTRWSSVVSRKETWKLLLQSLVAR